MRRSAPPGDESSERQAILDLVGGSSYVPLTIPEMLERLRVRRHDRSRFRRAVRSLLSEGRLVRLDGHRLAAARESLVSGRLRYHPRGFGFVIPDAGGKDVFVPPFRMGGAFHGDHVTVRVTGLDSEGRVSGEIAEVLRRSDRRAQGLFHARDRGGLVIPFDPSLGFAILIPGAFRQGALEGDAVEVVVLRPPRRGDAAEGKVVEVFGPLSRPGVDTMVVARRHRLVTEFPEDVLAAAARLPDAVPPREASRRERFDDPAPVTIDGETARDFDDAIAVSPLPGGGYRLWVHIADVAWFVRPGDLLDGEARLRGTSVYFPDRVLPMLPEKLSNDLCSLRPGEDRLVQSAVIDIDRSGRTTSVRFADGVIRSAARLTYTQAAAHLENRTTARRIPRPVGEMLRDADRLRRLLEARRRERGSIDFDLPEPRILLDVEGVVTGITIEPRNLAHRMIEEFMLAANEAVAARLEEAGAPCLFRVHERPDPVKLEALFEFAAALGLQVAADAEAVEPRDLQRLLRKVEGRPEEALLNHVALRSMKQARYLPTNSGHFGLAAEVYAHFTSPIRRYPDLVVHRALRATREHDRATLDALADGLEVVGESCSELERNAEAAERELLEWKKVTFMKGKEGQILDAVITGVAKFGLFAQTRETMVEGLVRIERLGADRFEYAERRHELRGASSGAVYRLGDAIRVVVERVDPIARRIDFGIASDAGARDVSSVAGASARAAARGSSRAAARGAERAARSASAPARPAKDRRRRRGGRE